METRRYGMLPADVYRLTGVADPHISPDGTRVAYQVWWVDEEENSYRGAIWSAGLGEPAPDGGAPDGGAQPRRLTWSERTDAAPRWSPDGKWLAFTSSRDTRDGGKAPQQLYVMPADGGEARRLTDGGEDVSQLAWSPDSTRIAFTRRVPDDPEEDERKRAPRRVRRLFYKLDGAGWLTDRRAHIFVASLDGGDVRQLTDGDCEDSQPAWSPDGGQIAFSSRRGERWDIELRDRIYLVNADGGEPVALTGTDGSCAGASFSPDGARIAHYFDLDDGTDPHNTQVAVIAADGSDHRLLTAKLDRHCRPVSDSMRLCWDGDRIVFTAEDHGSRHAYAVAADGSAEPELLIGGELVIAGFDARDGRVAYVASTHTAFPELYVAGARSSAAGRRLTGGGAAFAADRELAEPERFTAERADPAATEETGVDAWLVRPAGFAPGRSYPVLLSIHGGPFSQYTTGFFDEFQMYAAAGYAVVFANPRGSSGRSEEWGRAIRGPANGAGPGWGTVDFQDLMNVVDTALRRYPFLDAERMGVLGGSYGGFMTSWIVSHTDRFKAAIAERGVSNMVSLFGSSDVFWDFQRAFGGPMWEHPDAWRAMSPASYADRIRTPLLIIHSEQDLRCPIEQGEHLFTLLRLMGRETELLRFPAEGHELSRSGSPRHRVQRFEAILEWFGRYLA